jgi:hypothetical protein
VSTATDIWTSANIQSFITVTVHHFVNKALQSFVLTTKDLNESHSAEYFPCTLKQIFEEWKLISKINAVVTDSHTNIKATATKILRVSRLPCVAYLLNLIGNSAIAANKESETVPYVFCRLVCHFKKSVIAAEKIRCIKIQMGHEELKLKQDVPTRCNIALIMLERLLEIKEPLSPARFIT